MLDTREQEQVQQALDRYPNLEIISRDRGSTYKLLSPDCTHVVDRFHLVLNLSEIIHKEMRDYLPRHLKIEDERLPLRKAEADAPDTMLSPKQRQKMDLILEIQSQYRQGKGFRTLARDYHLSRKTIKRYVRAVDAADASIYHRIRKYPNSLDPYEKVVLRAYAKTGSFKAVQLYLEEKGIHASYHVVRRLILRNEKEKAEMASAVEENKIRRQDILKFLFGWKYTGTIDDQIDAVVSRYPAVLECQRFYREFRQNLTGLDPVAFLNQLSCPHEAPCLKRFIDSLRKDWQAVLNAAAYAFNNGIAEGTVNKIKQVKRDMYGRAGIDLLEKKVIFQSQHFEIY